MIPKFFVILVVCGLLELVLPWYVVAIVPLVICFTSPSRIGADFLCGFLAVFFLWLLAELFFDLPNEGLLSGRIALMFHLPSRWLLLLISACAGGLVSAFSAALGSSLRAIGKTGPAY